MKPALILLLLFTSILTFGQDAFNSAKIRASVLTLAKQFPQYTDSLMTEYVTYLYDTIFKKATENELYELTNHPNPLVRRSSFQTLLERHSPKVLLLLQKNAGDTIQYFQLQYGCFIESHTILDEVLFYLSPEGGWYRYFKITPEQKQTIATLIKRREKQRQEYFLSH